MHTLLKLGLIAALPFAAGLSMAGRPDLPDATVSDRGRETSAAAVAETGSAGYPEHLPGSLTGGFGESTCHSCHFDYDLNQPGGSLAVEGLEDSYKAGERYEISVALVRESLGRGGFQMTSRFEDGSQAGQFEISGDRLVFTPAAAEGIQYLQHSEVGTEPDSENTVRWTFGWIAPDNPAGPVIFNIAANAANGDRSEFGDWIYAEEITVRRAGADPSGR